jgi:flagellar P-ring protein precursor FlgI
MSPFRLFVLTALLGASALLHAETVRIKDLGRLSGWRENALVGYGLVTGLAGTGDSPRNQATRQSLANMLSRFDLTLSPDDLSSRNVAAVMVTSRVPGMRSTSRSRRSAMRAASRAARCCSPR